MLTVIIKMLIQLFVHKLYNKSITYVNKKKIIQKMKVLKLKKKKYHRHTKRTYLIIVNNIYYEYCEKFV